MMDTRTFFFEENASNICDHVYSIRYTILPPLPSLPLSLQNSQVMNFSFRASTSKSFHFHLPLRGCSLAKWNEKHSSTIHEKHWPRSFFLRDGGKRRARCSRGTWLDRRLLDFVFLCVVSFIGSVCSFTGLNWKLGSGGRGVGGGQVSSQGLLIRYERVARKDCWFCYC